MKWFFNKKVEKTESEDLFNEIVSLLIHNNPSIEKDRIKKNTEISDLGLDSIKYINVLVGMEEISGIPLEEIFNKIDLLSLRTVGDLVKLISQ